MHCDLISTDLLSNMDGAKIHLAVNSLLECSICLQVFQDPRNLSCGHTFCLKCIEKTNNRLCALCKREWSPPAKGLLGLPKNFVVENFTTSLPSISHCAVAGNNSHGNVKYFCIDCWDPLCEKCGQGHTQFSRSMKNHVVKLISEIHHTDIELHNRQRMLLCNQHKDKAIEFFCTDCDKLSCQTCYVLFHNTHKCISVEEAGAKLLPQLEDAKQKVHESIILSEEKLKTIKLSTEKLENDKRKLLEAVQSLTNNRMGKLQAEHEKIMGKLDECLIKGLTQLIVEKMNEEKKELEKFFKETQAKLKSLQEALLSLKNLTLPSSSAIERVSFLTDRLYSITQLTNMSEVTSYRSSYQLPEVNQWQANRINWLQLFTTMLSNMAALPQTNSKDVTIMPRYVRFLYRNL